MTAITFPGIVQALLMLICVVASFVSYMRYPQSLLVSLSVGSLLAIAGFVGIRLNWHHTPTLVEVLQFRARDFYQGTVVFSLGIGIVIGSLCAWIVTRCLRR
jgi:hypothetical protein